MYIYFFFTVYSSDDYSLFFLGWAYLFRSFQNEHQREIFIQLKLLNSTLTLLFRSCLMQLCKCNSAYSYNAQFAHNITLEYLTFVLPNVRNSKSQKHSSYPANFSSLQNKQTHQHVELKLTNKSVPQQQLHFVVHTNRRVHYHNYY